ncbi:MAG TPA: hypothetical protein VKP11_03385 [Frankiaceae bacterium]|nr:hypothetical protein [Frankiaceae bacterium]
MPREIPPTLRAATALVALQGLALLGVGVFLAVRGFGPDTADRGRAELGAVLAVAGGALFLLLSRGLLARRRWARSPTVVLELLSLPVGYGLVQGDQPGYGVPLLGVALAALVLLAVSGALRPD